MGRRRRRRAGTSAARRRRDGVGAVPSAHAAGMTRHCIVVAATLGVFIPGPWTRPAAAQDLALAGAAILNPADETTQRGVLLIKDGRVSRITETVPPDFPGETLDLTGKFVIPALADLHSHTFGNSSPAGTPQLPGTPGDGQRRTLHRRGIRPRPLQRRRDDSVLPGPAAGRRRAGRGAARGRTVLHRHERALLRVRDSHPDRGHARGGAPGGGGRPGGAAKLVVGTGRRRAATT